MTESDTGSLYYNYTNKGSTYQFDLSQLTPEERRKFNKLNERQKMKFITLQSLQDEGKMKNEQALKPVYIDEGENKRENDLRTLTAKLEQIKSYPNMKDSLKDEEVLKKLSTGDEYPLISKTDIDKVISVNPNAVIDTLRKYYEELIKDLKTEGENFKVKKAIMGYTLSDKASKASPEGQVGVFSDISSYLKKIYENFTLMNTPNKKLSPEERAIKNETKDTVEIVKEVVPKLLDITGKQTEQIIFDKTSLGQLIKSVDEFVANAKHIDVDITNLPEQNVGYTKSFKKKKEETGYVSKSFVTKEQHDAIRDIMNKASALDISPEDRIKQMNKVINGLAIEFDINPKNPENVKETYESIQNIIANKPYYKEVISKTKYFPKDTSDEDKQKYIAFASTIDDLGSENKEFKDAFNRFAKERIETGTPYKSGSIKDKLWKVFHPVEVQKEKLKSEISPEIDKLRREIEDNKAKIKELESLIINLQNSNSPKTPLPPKTPSEPPKFLNDISKPNLRKVTENEKNSKENDNSNDLESQLRKVMNERRQDISPDVYSEDDDEDIDWGAGIIPNHKKISLIDFLSN